MSQGVVTEYLKSLISRQVDEKGLVVWYDPEQAYVLAAEQLVLPSTAVARYDSSFFKLRNEIDPLLNDGQPPRLVVYTARSSRDPQYLDRDRMCRGRHAAPATTAGL